MASIAAATMKNLTSAGTTQHSVNSAMVAANAIAPEAIRHHSNCGSTRRAGTGNGHTCSLPFDAEHQDVDAGADAEQRDMVAFRQVAVFDAQRHGHRQRHGAGVAEGFDGGIVDRQRQGRGLRTSACDGRHRPGGKRSCSPRRPTSRLRAGIRGMSRRRRGFLRASAVRSRCPSAGACRRRPIRRGRCGRGHDAACRFGPSLKATDSACGDSSRFTSSTATLPEPIVSDAMARLRSLRPMVSSALSWAIVVSTSCRLPSVPTTRPARIWPSSIMLATCTMPLRMPRQAFETS